jgi:hypothetical protein
MAVTKLLEAKYSIENTSCGVFAMIVLATSDAGQWPPDINDCVPTVPRGTPQMPRTFTVLVNPINSRIRQIRIAII